MARTCVRAIVGLIAPLALAACGAKTGLLVPELPLQADVDLALAAGHTCARFHDGTVWCWGANDHGQLGDGSFVQRTVPVQVLSLTTATQIGTSLNHTCARLQNGTARCWGSNGGRELGVDGGDRNAPVAVPDLTGVEEVRAGGVHSCARLRDGTVRCWGTDDYEQLGFATMDEQTRRFPPTPVPGLSDVAQIDTRVAPLGNTSSSIALLSDGRVRYWPTTPVHVGMPGHIYVTDPLSWIHDVIQLSAIGGIEDQNFCVVLRDHTALCPRFDVFAGVLVTPADGTFPVPVPGIADVAEIRLGAGFACALGRDGTVNCWGANDRGQLGDGTTAMRLTPSPVLGVRTAKHLALGWAHACVLLDGGDIECWGANDHGQLGDGTLTDRSTPTFVPFPSGVLGAVITRGPGSEPSPFHCAAGDVETYEEGCGASRGAIVCRLDTARMNLSLPPICGCNGGTFDTSQYPPSQPWLDYNLCRRSNTGSAVTCGGNSYPIDGDPCAATDRDDHAVCSVGGCPYFCGPACVCDTTLHWRCTEDTCPHSGPGSAATVTAGSTGFYFRCVP